MNVSSDLMIIKASGETAPFDPHKLRNSLERTGASIETIDRVSHHILEQMDGITTTQQLYKKAYAFLKKISTAAASRYSLKKALLEFGPSGYPFERFVGELIKSQGYQIQVSVVIQGHCVQHEIDVVAHKGEKKILVECKFHIDQGRKSDVKTPLYIHSRFQDVKKQERKKKDSAAKFYEGWIVTNTRFSEDALQYGNCVGLKLICWDYPKKGSLKQRIAVSGLHPITCLGTLTRKEKEVILEKGIVLCKQLCEHSEALDALRISSSRQKKILIEAKEICSIS